MHERWTRALSLLELVMGWGRECLLKLAFFLCKIATTCIADLEFHFYEGLDPVILSINGFKHPLHFRAGLGPRPASAIREGRKEGRKMHVRMSASFASAADLFFFFPDSSPARWMTGTVQNV